MSFGELEVRDDRGLELKRFAEKVNGSRGKLERSCFLIIGKEFAFLAIYFWLCFNPPSFFISFFAVRVFAVI